MIKPIRQACRFNPVIRDYRMAQGIENLARLIEHEGDGREFFSHNYVTHGMEQLFREGLLRLSGKSDQAVFELTQAMGGGKTHLMIALGLLARHPHLRPAVLTVELNERVDFGQARIAAFNGRNNPANYLWGEIATQLGEAEAIKPFWVNGPRAVDQRTWKEIIGIKPTLLLLDELPPYLDVTSTQALGDGTLASMVVYSLGSLMSAALELPNCAIVVANLSGSYKSQTRMLHDAISNLQQETRRQALTITPVQLAGNEIYGILKKRLIDQLPDERTINDVAEEYAREVKKAEDSGYIVAASLEQIAEQVRQTYPFHPSFKHLVALFKENEGFRQTRGLMQFTARLLKSVEQRDGDVFLIGTQHLDLNDPQVKDEIDRIAPKLAPAVSRDVSDNGNAIAETIDAELGSDAAREVMGLLLASSLSRAVGGRIGLSESELIEFLAAPYRKADEFKEALERLRELAWYLHREDQRFYVKETENLSRQIERNAKDIPQPKIDQAFINRLTGIFSPERRVAYQDVQVLPKLEELKLGGPRTVIVIKPDGKIPPAQLENFFQYQAEKNNLLVLTGQDSLLADVVEDRLRELYAIEQIEKRLKPGDTLFEEARDRREEGEDRFLKALSAAYNRLLFPAADPIDGSDRLVGVTIDNGLKLGEGEHSAEAQVEALLSSPSADYKLVREFSRDNFPEYFVMAEEDLWPSGRDSRRTPWKDVVSRAKSLPKWPWMPGSGGLEALRAEALKQGRWRLGQDGYIEKGPFPKEKSTLNVSVASIHVDGGQTVLSITPRHAGESPTVYWSTQPDVSDKKGRKVEDLDTFSTPEGTLYFWVKDPTGRYESGPAVQWLADLKIRHQVTSSGGKRRVELAATPRADLFYTLDGSNPKDGKSYEGPFEIGSQALRLLVYGRAGEANRSADFQIPVIGDNAVQILDTKPARVTGKRVLDTTDRVFAVINRFRDQPATRFKGVRIELGEGENTVTVRFQEREVTAAIMEGVVNALREVLREIDAPVTITIQDGIKFDTGFAAREFAKIAAVDFKPGELTQDE